MLGQSRGGAAGEIALTRKIPPRKYSRRAYMRGHITGTSQGLKSDGQKSNPACIYTSLCLSFIIYIIGVKMMPTAQGNYDDQVN